MDQLVNQFNNLVIDHELKTTDMVRIIFMDTRHVYYYNNGKCYKYNLKTRVKKCCITKIDLIDEIVQMCNTYCILNRRQSDSYSCYDTTHIPWTLIRIPYQNNEKIFFKKSRQFLVYNLTMPGTTIMLMDFSGQIIHRWNHDMKIMKICLNEDETKCAILVWGQNDVFVIDLVTYDIYNLFKLDVKPTNDVRTLKRFDNLLTWDAFDNIFYYKSHQIIRFNIPTQMYTRFDGPPSYTIHTIWNNYIVYQKTTGQNDPKPYFMVYKVDAVNIYEIFKSPEPYYDISRNALIWIFSNGLFYQTQDRDNDHDQYLNFFNFQAIDNKLINKLLMIRYRLMARQIDFKHLFDPFLSKISVIKTYTERAKLENEILKINKKQMIDYHSTHHIPLSHEQIKQYEQALIFHLLKLLKKHNPHYSLLLEEHERNHPLLKQKKESISSGDGASSSPKKLSSE